MAQIIREVSIDVAKSNIFQAIIAKQHDSNSRFLKATITNQGKKINIESSSIVTINGLRADEESKSFAGSVNEDGTVTVPLTNWLLELDGRVKCDISIVDAEGRKLTTTKFTLLVEAAAYDGSDITEEEDADLLISILAECAGAKEAVEGAERISNKGAPGGYAGLDENGKIPSELILENEEVKAMQADINSLKGISIPKLTPVEGKYGASTSFATAASFAYSGIFKLAKGQILIFSCTTQITSSSIVSALFSCNSLEDTRPRAVLVDGLGAYQEYTYTATADVEYVAFNYKIADGYDCKILGVSALEKQVNTNTIAIEELKASSAKETLTVGLNTGTITASTGGFNSSHTSGQYTDLFSLTKGETIEFTANGYTNGSIAVLYRYSDNGGSGESVFVPLSKDAQTFVYTETKEIGYYRACTYQTNTAPLEIKKFYSTKNVTETFNKTGAENHDYLKLLFDKVVFIGDSLTRGVLGSTNGTNNKANYPYYVHKLTGWDVTSAGDPGDTTLQYWQHHIEPRNPSGSTEIVETDVAEVGDGFRIFVSDNPNNKVFPLDFADKDACFILLGENGGFEDSLEADTTITGGQTYWDYADTNTGAYCKLIEYIKEQNPDIHIFMLQGKRAGNAGVATVLPQIAEKYGLPLLDVYYNGYFHMSDSYHHPAKPDGTVDTTHFGRIGYLDLAKSILNMTFDYINEHKADYEYPYPG